MSFKEEVKLKKDYFTQSYTKEEILRTFQLMLKRAGKKGELQGQLEEMKITKIEGDVITVEARMQDKEEIRLYRFSLQFTKMENENFEREAKIASPERYGEVVELKVTANKEEKQMYYENVIDYWEEREEKEKKIREVQETNQLLEKYKKEDLLNIVDTMLQTSANSKEILGEIVERKIIKIEGNIVSIAMKTKDVEEVRIYVMSLDFNKMKTMGYCEGAKISSPQRIASAREVKGLAGNEGKEDFYNRIPDFWDKSIEEQGKEEK